MSHKTKQQRRAEATERQSAYVALTLDEKFARLDSRPGDCWGERDRLLLLLLAGAER